MYKSKRIIKEWIEIGLECSNRRMYEHQDTLWDIVRNLITRDMHEEECSGYWNEKFSSICDYEGDLSELHFYYSDKDNEIDTMILNEICKRLDIEYDESISGLIKFTNFSTPQ